MRFGPEDMTPPAEHKLAAHQPAPLWAQLQINQTGSWRGALDFDLVQAPPEFLQTADQLARLAGARTTMRVVRCRYTDAGSKMPTGNVLKRWARDTGWVTA